MLIEPFNYPEMFKNEAVDYVEKLWQRKLTDHEKHIIFASYDFIRTVAEANELKFLWTK